MRSDVGDVPLSEVDKVVREAIHGWTHETTEVLDFVRYMYGDLNTTIEREVLTGPGNQ